MSNTKKINELEEEVQKLKQLIVHLLSKVDPEAYQGAISKLKEEN